MASFETAYQFLYKNEGEYANNPNDLGGETKYGISKRQFPNEDIKNLTPERAKLIMKNVFWDPYRLSEIIYQELANHVFDMTVNAGGDDGPKYLQKAAIHLGRDLKVDGAIGDKTLTAVNILDGKMLLRWYRFERSLHYIKEVQKKPMQIMNFQSWIRRASL